jgi:hypothetical protein
VRRRLEEGRPLKPLVLAAIAAGLLLGLWAKSGEAHPRELRGPSADNPIVRENKKAGTKLGSLWSSAPGRAMEAYLSQSSVAPGELLQLHASTTPAARFLVFVYRLGYYRGLGTRLLPCPVCRRALQGRPQPMDSPDPATGMVRETWPVTTQFRIPRGWVSGEYLARLTLTSGPNANRSANIPFIVRRTARSKILVVSQVNTGQAYNNWGGKSLYDFNSTGAVAANHVSFDRPSRPGATAYFFDSSLTQLLEQTGFDVSYASDIDVHRNPAELLRHRLVIVLGHGEYWSRQIRDAYETARDQGVNLAFFGGDIGDWQIRYEDRERTIVAYKSRPDPYPDPAERTTNFSRLQPPRPQCQLIGTQFGGGHGFVKSYGINAAALSDPWFKGTGFKAGDTFVGNNYEYDLAAPAGCPAYPSITFFADSTRPDIAPAVRYTAASGARVFGVGSFALSSFALGDRRVRRFTQNAIADLAR